MNALNYKVSAEATDAAPNYAEEIERKAYEDEITRVKAHAEKLAEALRKLIESCDKAMWLSMQVEDVLTLPRNKAKHALAAYEAAQ